MDDMAVPHRPDSNTLSIGLDCRNIAVGTLSSSHRIGKYLLRCQQQRIRRLANTELRNDPLGPIIRVFGKMVNAIRRPIVVFVDDLDRCETKYVVELLEGIQTLFRTVPVVYVVEADRKWICSSFEKGYEDFDKTIGEPGRPLGYLFLDKIFQISSSVPRLSPEARTQYWKGLLRTAPALDSKNQDDERKDAEREAAKIIKDKYTQEEFKQKISEVRDDPLRKQAMRAAAAKQITSPEAQRETEHRLQRFSDLLEPNPRSMKRLVNSFGLYQARHFLEGREVTFEALARWTIIELRWPLLADFLTSWPNFITHLASVAKPVDYDVPDDLKELFGNDVVKRVVADGLGQGIIALDETAIRQIAGLT